MDVTDYDFTGLLIDDKHIPTINSFEAPPPEFCADVENLPDEYHPKFNSITQLRTNSCAGHASAAAFMFENYVITGEVVNFSPWFAYRTSQQEGGYDGQDGGTSITSVLKAATKFGNCDSSLCVNPGHSDRPLSSSEYRNSYPSKTAFEDAAKHKHLGDLNVDLRDFDKMISWVTDLRCVVIGSKWFSGQSTLNKNNYIETKAAASSGNMLGYHARLAYCWKKVNGIILPWIRNSHGSLYGLDGETICDRECWEWYKTDPNFFALGFSSIAEKAPKRRIWTADDIKRSGRGSAFRKALAS